MGTETETGAGAGAALGAALRIAIAARGGMNGVYEGAPLQASLPYALLDCSAERDWGHKSGEGREIRVALTIRDRGETPERLRRLMRGAEAAAGGLAPGLDGWRLVTLAFLGSRMLREADGWSGAIDWRARMLKEA